MEGKEENITLDVDETLYLERGQEVEEMLSISLDPDISLDEYETDLLMHGIIVLNGTYRKSNTTPEGDKEKNDGEELLRYIEKIVEKENDEADFYHRFPVEISIPKDRVSDTADVSATITAFDYELPNSHTLKIRATLHIAGFQKDEQPEKLEEPEEIQEKDNTETLIESPEEVEVKDDSERLEEAEDDTEPISQEKEKEAQEIDISLKKNEEAEEAEETTNVQFLTELFGNDEEEMRTTITLYIAQEEDTVETIAKRFELPTLQLIKDNDLSGDKLESGQLLYITRN